MNACSRFAVGAWIALQLLPSAAATREPKTFVPPPILMYHRIDVDTPGDAASRDLTLTPSRLQDQLAYLKARGLMAISMADLAGRLRRHASIDRVVVLTFDDGYADQYRYAVPLLRRFGQSATFYVVTGELGKARHLTWPELKMMSRDGLDIAAHGVQHDDLSAMNPTQQRYQIQNSIHRLSAFLHSPIASYAYPAGRFNRATLDIVRRERIPLAVTTDTINVLPPETRLQLTRVRVHEGWTLQDFAQALGDAVAARRAVLR